MAVTHTLPHNTPTARTTGIAAESIAAAASATGDDIDNATNKDTHADIELAATFGTAPAAGAPVQIHLIYKMDGTNAETVVQHLAGVVGMADVTSAQRAVVSVPILPYKFAIRVTNGTAQTANPVTVTCNTRRAAVDAV